MRNFLSIISLILICISCSNSSKQKSAITERRFLCGFSNDSLKIRTEYTLTKITTDSIIKFDYSSRADSSRNFNFEFKKHRNELIFAHTGYKKSEIN